MVRCRVDGGVRAARIIDGSEGGECRGLGCVNLPRTMVVEYDVELEYLL